MMDVVDQLKYGIIYEKAGVGLVFFFFPRGKERKGRLGAADHLIKKIF
jgi:hypothetical protein